VTTRITPWNRIPPEYSKFAHDPLWSRYGQFVAGMMIRFLSSALGSRRRVVHPRVVAYPGIHKKLRDNPQLPADDAGGLFYMSQNVVVLRRPWKRNAVLVTEYKRFSDSPIIGEMTTSGRRAFLSDLAHEVAHWAVDRMLILPNEPVHGFVWRAIYALLRERFVNGKKTMPKLSGNCRI